MRKSPKRGMSSRPEQRPIEGPRPGDWHIRQGDLPQRVRRHAQADSDEVQSVVALVPPRARWSR